MKFLADMGISQTTVGWLRDQGYDAIHLREQGFQTLEDYEILKKARQEERIVLTCDLDFGDLMAAYEWDCPSVVIFRLQNERPENVNKKLAQVLEESFAKLLSGAVIAVEEYRYRVRSLPI